MSARIMLEAYVPNSVGKCVKCIVEIPLEKLTWHPYDASNQIAADQLPGKIHRIEITNSSKNTWLHSNTWWQIIP